MTDYTPDNFTVATSPVANTGIEPSYQWQPFPFDSLPYVVRDFVEEVSLSIGIDPAHVAISVLVPFFA